MAGPSDAAFRSCQTAAVLVLLLVHGCSAVQRRLRPFVTQTDNTSPELTLQELEITLEQKAELFERRIDDWTLHATDRWQHHLAELTENQQLGSAELHQTRVRRDAPHASGEFWHSYNYHTGVGNREELTLHGLYSGRQLYISGPVLDAPPQWQVASHKGIFFLFGLYPFAGTTKLHLIKTDFGALFLERTVNFSAADLRVTPFLHYIHTSHGVQLFLFVKRAMPMTGLYGDRTHPSEQIFCFLIDQETLQMVEACAPVTLPSAEATGEILVDTLVDATTGTETIVLFPVQQTHGLITYKLSAVPYSSSYALSLYLSIESQSPVWQVRLFTVAGRSYAVIAYGEGPLHSMIQIFRYDTEGFTLIQTLPVTDFVISMEIFGIGFQRYLVLGQHSVASLYLWHGTEFELLQEQASALTYRWIVLPIHSCRHEVILAKVVGVAAGATFQRRQVEFYVHNVRTGQFDQVQHVPCSAGDSSGEGLRCFQQPDDVLDLTRLVGVHTESDTYIIIPSKEYQLILVTVNASVDFAPDPVWLENQQLLERKAALQARYTSILQKIERLKTVLDSVVVPGSDQLLQGDYNFVGRVTADSLEAPDAAINRVRLAGFSGDVFQLLAPISELTGQVETLEAAISYISSRLRDVVMAGSPNILVSGDKNFAGNVSITSLQSSGSVRINTVGGQDLNSTLSDIVTLDSGRLISGKKTVAAALNVFGDLTVGHLNGHPIVDIVTDNTIQELTGPVSFVAGALSVDKLSVSGLLDGVHVQELALFDGSGQLPVSVSVTSLASNNLSVGLLNGQTPDAVFSNVLLSAGGTFTHPVTFKDSVSAQDVQVTGTLNGEETAGLLSALAFTDAAQRVAWLRLERAAVAGHLAPLTVNGRPLSAARLVTAAGAHPVSGAKVLSRVTAARVTAGRLDGVPPGQLVTLDSTQAVDQLQLSAAHVLGRLTVGGRLDGVRLAPGWLDHLLTNGSQTLHSSLVFSGAVTQLGGMSAAAMSSGQLPLHELLERLLVHQDGHAVSVGGRKRLLSSVSAGPVTVHGLVNGAEPADWLTLSTDQLVAGPLTLSSRGLLSSLLVVGRVDGVYFSQLARRAVYTSSEQPQLVFGVKAFDGAVTTTELRLVGPLNGLLPEGVLWTHGDQVVTGRHWYQGTALAGGLHTYGQLTVPDGALVGGQDFSQLSAQAERSAAEAAHAQVLVLDRMVVRGDVTVDSLDGHELGPLLNSVLRRRGGVVTGRWRFQTLRVTGSATSAAGAGGFHLSRLRSRLISLASGGPLTAPLAFERLVVADGGSLSGQLLLGGRPWQAVQADLARQSQTIVINGSKTFTSSLHIRGSVQSQSLPLHNVLTVGSDQVVTAAAFFHSDVIVHAGLITRRPVNGAYDVSQLPRLFVTDAYDVSVNGDIVFWGAAAVSGVNVTGLVVGRRLSDVLASAVRLGSDATLAGRLAVSAPLWTATMRLRDGHLNGRALARYLATVRLATADQTFSGGVTAGTVTAVAADVRHLTVLGLLDGVNCTELLQRAILLTDDYTFSGLWSLTGLTVTGNLDVVFLNGQLVTHLLRLDGAGVIDQLRIVGDIYANSIVNASRLTTLNGLDLWMESSLLFRLSHSMNQTYLAELTFTGNVAFDGHVALGGLLNGFNVSDAVVLGAPGTIVGNFQVTGALTADTVFLDGLLNGINVSLCAGLAVYADRDATLLGEHVFTSVELADTGRNVVAGVAGQRADVAILLQECQRQFRDFNSFFSAQCLEMQNLYDSQRSTYYALRYFDVEQEISWLDLRHIISSLVLKGGSSLHVLVTYARLSDGCAESRLLRWDGSSGLLRLIGLPLADTGAARQWRHLRLAGRQLLVSAAGPPPPGCGGRRSAIWSWDGATVRFVQSLEVWATQVLYTEAPLGLPSLLLMEPAGDSLWQFTYDSDSGTFVGGPEPSRAELIAARQLADGSLLLLSAQNSTVVVRRETAQLGVSHQQTLGALSATALLTYTIRGRVLFAVGDGGWSSLLNRPQGVKIFEYFGNGTHRCVPVQHLEAVNPSDLTKFAAGSLPDVFLAVAEKGCGLRIFVDQGEAGFVEFQRVTLSGTSAVSVLSAPGEPEPRLLVTAGRRLVLFAAHMTGAHVAAVRADCAPHLAEPHFST